MSLRIGTRTCTDKKMHTGHFYFAKNRTFLLCVDNMFPLCYLLCDTMIGKDSFDYCGFPISPGIKLTIALFRNRMR